MIKAILNSIFLIITALMLSACNGTNNVNPEKAYKHLSKDDPYNTKYKGHYKVGQTYKIKGREYTPKHVTRYTKVGTASWYGSRYGFHGKATANGDIYNKNLLTAAHKTLPMPSLVEVTNLENGRSLVVMVNDRGPYAYNREIDLSEKSANILGFRHKGTAKVKVKYLHKETLQFLDLMGLKQKEGKRANRELDNNLCTVNCHIKLMNLKHKKNKTHSL